MNCFFADYKVEIINGSPHWGKKLSGYISDSEVSDFTIAITEKDIEYEKTVAEAEATDGTLRFTACYRILAEKLPLYNTFVLHSAVFDVDGTGVAFAAQSGTGKTTHMLLWQRLLGDRLKIVNGDKPIVRFFDEEPNNPYAYGTPWNGKEHLGCNMRTPLKHICFIERAKQNSCERVSKTDAVNLIFNQVYMPKDPMAAMNTVGLIDRMLSCCNLWKIKCNMDISAAETAYNTILGSTIGRPN